MPQKFGLMRYPLIPILILSFLIFPVYAYFPLDLSTLEKIQDGEISYEVKDGDILVTIVDRYGDAHIHLLSHEGISQKQALNILSKKTQQLDAENRFISKEQALEIADKIAKEEIGKVNKRDAKQRGFKYEFKYYKKKLHEISTNGQECYSVLYQYKAPLGGNILIPAGHPSHFSVRVDKITGETILMQGE
ncbi:MAG: hypothetical protein ABH873_07070 [Candidatus Firestonebacteria bacterium]